MSLLVAVGEELVEGTDGFRASAGLVINHAHSLSARHLIIGDEVKAVDDAAKVYFHIMNDDGLGPARFEVQDAEGCKTAVVTQELEQVGVDDATRDEEDSTVLLGLIMEEFLAEGLAHEGLQALPLHFKEGVKVLSTHDISSRGKLAVE